MLFRSVTILQNANPNSVLVRDDYAAYEKLPLKHQSCLSHLLRKSHELSNYEHASKEAKELHHELKIIFFELKEIIERSFNQQEREKLYKVYLKKIQNIQQRKYLHPDVKQVQTRIINQGANLITALKYDEVPLTNNHAEKQIRSIVITRKISGGSQSNEGAETHAFNMSIC